MLGRGGRTVRILLVLLVVAAVVVGLAVGVYREFGSVGLTGLSVVVSGILTAALVILYFHQTSILDAQRELLTQELQREARQQHTETLRTRVERWHGNPGFEQSGDILNEADLNLPKVLGASFQSAPNDYRDIRDEEAFHVIPAQLQGDRYLEDLLKHHAPDLRDTAEEIRDQYQEFVQLRTAFVEGFDAAPVRETDVYRLEPQDRLGQWLFELLVLLERDRFDEFAELRDRAWSDLERGNNGPHSDKPKLDLRVALGHRMSSPVYTATWQDALDQETIRAQQDAVEAEVNELIAAVLDRVEANRPYERTVRAAEMLDAAADTVDRLENLLVEYHGRPIYPGKCEYLEETRIQDV